MRPGPAISVVIPTRRRPHLLPRSVAAVLAQTTSAAFEVIVVNDDDEPLRCRLPDDPRLRVLTGSARGVCRARNTGIRAAGAPIIAFTDDDTIATPGWLAAVLDAFAAHPDAVGVEGPIEYGREPDLLYEHVPVAALPGSYCTGNVAYRVDALIGSGMFDERFKRAGAEDIDLGLRIAALGPVIVAPEMIVEHPPRLMGYREWVGNGRQVQNDWLLHRKHPDFVPHRLPLRWSPVIARGRACAALLQDPSVIRRSGVRLIRAVALGAGMMAVAFVTACTEPVPDVDPGAG